MKNFIILLFLISFFCLEASSSPATNRAAIEKQRKEAANQIVRLKQLEKKEKDKLIKNQLFLEATEKDLIYSKQKYGNTHKKLSQLEKDLAESLALYNVAEYRTGKRIRQIFKTHRQGFFSLLITAEDMNVFFDRLYFENLIIDKDKKELEKTRKKAEALATVKNQIEQEKIYLVNSINNINNKQANLQKAINKNECLIQKLRTNRLAYERSEKELARQSANLATMINNTTKTTTSSVAVPKEGFIKPIAGQITSPFGYRIHPIFKSRTFHSGVDIAGPNNGAVKASNSGKVIFTGWYGGYGKVVIIDHGSYNGSPTSTLYAHLNSFIVGVGAQVKKGQVIGYEGTTGYSTGPHVHFEVRLNGKPNNPMLFIR